MAESSDPKEESLRRILRIIVCRSCGRMIIEASFSGKAITAGGRCFSVPPVPKEPVEKQSYINAIVSETAGDVM